MEAYEYEVMAAVEGRHWWYRGMRALSAAWLDDVYGEWNQLRILDAGCGTGGNAEFLRRYGTVAGLDIEPLALRLGQRRLPRSLVRASVADLPFRDGAFDLVTSFDVLYHRAVIDESLALAETVRVLRPGGRLLLRLPAYRWLYSSHDKSVHGRHRYTAGEARRLVVESGLRVERVSYINSVLFPVAVLQRMAERVLPSAPADRSDLELPRPAVNTLLSGALSGEAAWLRAGGRFAWGLSILLLAQK